MSAAMFSSKDGMIRMAIPLEVDPMQLATVLDSAGPVSVHWIGRDGLSFESWDNEALDSCWEALMAGLIDWVDVRDLEDNNKVHRVTRESVVRAVQVIAAKYPYHLGRVVSDESDHDAETGDYLLQCACFGEARYA